jgi:hypothetical protein
VKLARAVEAARDSITWKLDHRRAHRLARRGKSASPDTDDELLAYLDDILAEMDLALSRCEQRVADRLAALLLGLERRTDVRELASRRPTEFRVFVTRWHEMRVHCRFPSDDQLRAAMVELCLIAPEPEPERSTT